jgi:carbamoyl-phosphate synthase large subunit
MKLNILVTSAGRRVSLINSFKYDLNILIPGACVFTADCDPDWSSACRSSDGYFSLPKVTNSYYVSELLVLCLRESIGLVVPTIDTELEVLSENVDLFARHGISVAVSSLSLVRKCRDKRETNKLFSEIGLDVPRTVDKLNPTYPLFVKPYDGSLSKDILLINDQQDLTTTILGNEKLMFMEYLNPIEFQEFSVDAYFNRDGVLKCMVPRRRVEIRGGEISKGRTEKLALYEVLKVKFNYLSGAKACLTMQFFEHRASGRIVGIEINPRFGGGYPLSYAAGACFPAFLIKEYLLGQDINFFDGWTDQMVMLRYDSELILNARDFS